MRTFSGSPIALTAAIASLSLGLGCRSRIETGSFPTSWYAGGATCSGTPALRVHSYSDDLYILRQPACTNYEKPFLYLLIGDQRALLLDTGAGGLNVASTVDSLLASWRARHGGRPAELIVAHSHAHSDHTRGDSLFAGRSAVTLVARDTASVRKYFGIQRWPDEIVSFDLGHRVLDIIPIPGHQGASIAIYDRRTALLLTGDTFYPGRLYVADTAAFALSIRRLATFASQHPVKFLLGTHVENSSTPSVDYPVETIDQPHEHVLQLSVADLMALDSAVTSMRGRFTRVVMPHFTIWPR
jgi:glyoxylase-like metal-dependent hydrolase (beta-lactamase superfamily II)